MLVSSIERHEQGMGMVLRKEAIQALIGYKSMGPRMIKARFSHSEWKSHNRASIMHQQPVDRTREDAFHEELQQTIQEIPNQDLIIIMGDFNAKVGRDWKTWWGVIGKHAEKKMSEAKGC